MANNQYQRDPYTSDNNDCSDEQIAQTARWLSSLTPTEFTVIGSIVAIIIANGLTYNEQNSIGNFLQMLGQIITTYNAQVQTLQAPSPTCYDFKALQAEIRKINQYLNR